MAFVFLKCYLEKFILLSAEYVSRSEIWVVVFGGFDFGDASGICFSVRVFRRLVAAGVGTDVFGFRRIFRVSKR